MKLAWLCYGWYDHVGYPSLTKPIILFVEPTGYEYSKIVPIVYTEIVIP
jgi:hypothetical protein